nr:MetaGeneMark_Unknown Function [uncultured bacterium]
MSTTANSTTKEVRRNRETKDFDMYLNGRYVGSCATPQAARAELDRIVFAELTH